MKSNKDYLTLKIESINELSTEDIKKASREKVGNVFGGLTQLFKDKDREMTETEIFDFVSIIFVLEALILSKKMRDERLSNLAQKELESLAMELYISIEKMRSCGEGYMEMCDAADKIIDEHLSNIKSV